MAYTHHLNDAAYYLFLGTNGGRMFQVKLSMIVLFYARLLLCAQGRSQDLLSGEAIPYRARSAWRKFC